MPWEEDLFALFDELEGQAEALYDAERAPELADRSRAEYQQVTLASRLMAEVGASVHLEVVGVGAIAGELDRMGTGWVLVRGPAQDWIVATDAITTVAPSSGRSVPEMAWSPLTRLTIGSALRRLSEAGERCVVHLRDGASHDGTIARVGADFVEVVATSGRRLLFAFAQLAAVQSRDG